MERANFTPEEGDKADKPAAEKKQGLVERFLKNKEQKSEAKNGDSKEARVEKPKSKLAKIAQQVLKLVRSEQPAPEQVNKEQKHEQPDEKAEKVEKSLPKDTQAETEADPIIEQARDTRRFASKVLNLVMKVIGREDTQPRDRNIKAEVIPETVAPLKEAAADLDQAIDELDNVLPAAEAEQRDPAEDNNATMSQTAEFANEGGDWNPPKPEVAAPKLPERPIEIKKPMTSKEKMLHNLAKSGLGFVALGSAFALNRYYKKQKREFSELKKFKRKQQEFNKVLQAKPAEQPYLPNKTAKTQEQISNLSEFTHKQADITRETAEQVRQHEQDKKAPLEIASSKTEVQNIEGATLSQRNTEVRTNKQSETLQPNGNESLKPLLTVENDDRIEVLPNNSQKTDDQTQTSQTKASANSQNIKQKQDQLRQTLTDAGVDPDKHVPKQVDQPWLFTIALALVVVIVVMAVILT